MFLFKRNSIYYIQYLDEYENREKRISTRKRTKPEALKFLSEFKDKLKSISKVQFITLGDFQKDYEEYIDGNYSKNYAESVVGLQKSLDKRLSILRETFCHYV